MTGLSVLTLARGRTPHLLKLIEGLERCEPKPLELVVVDMNDEALQLPSAEIATRLIRLPGGALPLASARNLAARSAKGKRLLFLDADCIPSKGLIGAIDRALDEVDGLLCPEALYLGPNDARDPWTESELAQAGRPHPVRLFPAAGMREEHNAGLFWSLAFGVRRPTFEAIGGFDEAFIGYGGEDTDFGLRAKSLNIPLMFMSGERVFHQHHPISDPPIEHLADIVRNARLFFRKWGRWPMEGWLTAFETAGLLRVAQDTIELTSSGRQMNVSRGP